MTADRSRLRKLPAPACLRRAAAVILLVLLGGCASARFQDPATIGIVRQLEGSPRVIRLEGYAEVGPDSVLLRGDALLTGEAGAARIRMPGGTAFELGPSSQLSLQTFDDPAPRPFAVLALLDGIILLKTGNTGEQALVRLVSPFAAVDIHGTGRIGARVDVTTGLSVCLLSDVRVVVSNSAGEIELTGKWTGVRVSPAEAPRPAVICAESDWVSALESR